MSAVACPECGRDNPEGFRFCGFCAAPLAAETAAPREERKVVTVLFCDLVGFTSRAERLDPEDVRAFLTPYHERVKGELERFGGTVEKFIGDAVMAVFGAPTVHEDDAERAVRAALAIRDWAREEQRLQVRIGLTTGEALINLGARPERGEGIAAGDVVNTAARLQSAAPENGVLVGETTYRATRRAIDYREAEPVAAKGKAEPIAVWEAVAARSRAEVERPASTPFVGRVDELATLVNALSRARRELEPQLVTLVGAPGIGKSRLVYELFRTIEEDSELVYWRRGRSLPYGEGVSFWALGEIVKAQAGILESDSAGVAREKLRAAVDGLGGSGDAGWFEEHLGVLVGAGVEPDPDGDRREEAFAAWRRFLEALAEQRPLVLVFEDLQWADEGMLDFVDHLADWAQGVPLLVLCTARPELLERRPAWGGGKLNAATILLGALSGAETAALVRALLARAVIPADLEETILDRAGGNALYAEEFVRLLEDERREVALPESVQGIIAARLDLLTPGEKRLLQDAAVVGRVFWAGALSALGNRGTREIETALNALARREHVQRERRSSVAGEMQYAFRHALVRDVAYGQIPRGERADRHRRAARWIESLGRPEDHAEMLAHHYLSALEYGRAVSADLTEITRVARPALYDAGERAAALNAFAPAGRFYEEALRLTAPDDPTRGQLLLKLGRALAVGSPDRAESVLAEAADALSRVDDEASTAQAEALLAEIWWFRGRRERGLEHLERARALVRDRGPSAAKAHVLSEVARYLTVAGLHDEAICVGQEALALAERLELSTLRARVLTTVGSARVNAGDMSGSEDIERAIEIALATNSPETARGYNNLASAMWLLGDPRAVEMLEHVGREAERFGNAAWLRFSRGSRPGIAFLGGDWDEALRLADEFVAEVEGGSPHTRESDARDVRALIWFARGESDAAVEELERALEASREAAEPQSILPTLSGLLRTLVELGRLDEARPRADEILASERERLVLPPVCAALGWTGASVGREREAAQFLEAAHPSRWTQAGLDLLAGEFESAADRLAEIGHRPDEALARLRGAEHLLVQGRRAEADAQLQQALAFWRSVGATRFVEEGERLLARVA